jgi:predicted nucleotidyltransferase
LDEVREVLRSNGVRSAFAFGSVCTGNFNEGSDIDILVEVPDGLDPMEYSTRWWNICFSLEDRLKRRIDLLTPTSIRNPFLRDSIMATREKIL